MQIDDWTVEFASEIRRLRASLPAPPLVAALPVYNDCDSMLLISEAGDTLRLNDVIGTIEPLHDEDWHTVAVVSAARRFPTLARLRPTRPSAVESCAPCDGAGLLREILCGDCYGTGWVRT